jgi:hypothetical protein
MDEITSKWLARHDPAHVTVMPDPRLVEAAPDMLAALTAIHDITQDPNTVEWQRLQNIAATAAAAIAKAIGGKS